METIADLPLMEEGAEKGAPMEEGAEKGAHILLVLWGLIQWLDLS